MSDVYVFALVAACLSVVPAVIALVVRWVKKIESHLDGMDYRIDYCTRIANDLWRRELDRNEDVSSAYFGNGGTSIGRINFNGKICDYCRSRIVPGSKYCEGCGALNVDYSAVEMWGGK